MTIDPNGLTRAWNETFLPKPDLVTQSSTLAAAAYAAVSGAVNAGNSAWARLRMDGNAFAFVGAAAPTDDLASVLVRNTMAYEVVIPPGEQLWLIRQGTTSRRGSCEVWTLS